MDMSSTVSETITITANGDERKLPEGSAVVDLLEQMEIDPSQSGIAVAVDGAVVSKSDWAETTLESGTRVEVITATQGG